MRSLKCFLFWGGMFCAVVMTAQNPSTRTVEAVIADVLAQLPACQSAVYNQSMMELIETGTAGVERLVRMLHEPGKDDNSTVEYALSGMVFFASNDDKLKNTVEQGLIASIDVTNEPETKAFLIHLLAIAGSEVAIHKLAGYLADDRLSSPAANAIVSIGGESAGRVLQMALMRRMARSSESEQSIIQALGDITPVVDGTEELLATMINAGDQTTKGIVLKALGRTGSKQSLAVLGAAVASTGYRAELTDAGGAYLRLIKRVYEQGDTKEAIAAAQALLKNATKAGSHQIREAALEILFYNRADVIKLLKTALRDRDKAYRNAALRFTSVYADRAIYTELLKSLPKAKTGEKIDVIYWIGNEALSPEKNRILKTIETGIEKTGLQTLVQLLSDPEIEVKQATAFALGAIGDPSTLPALTDLLKSKDSFVLSWTKEVLASFPADVSTALTKVVSLASDEGKIIIMELLSARKANTYFTLVLDQTKSASPAVVNAAYTALKDVVSEKDFIVLCGMLETAAPAYIPPLQQAVASSIASLTPEKQTEMIKDRILQAGDAKMHLFEPVLSSINYF